MYNSNNKQYIFKQTSGKVWNFFYDEKLGLCYSTLTKRNTWTEPVSLQKSLYPIFHVDMDYDDCFHILFQDSVGNIFYTRMEKDDIKTIPVLNSKKPTPYNKHLFSIPQKNVLHIFFVIEHNDTVYLAYQTLSDGTISSPRVIDYVIGNEHPYSIICDKSGNIYAFFQCSDGKYLQIGYKKFTPAQKHWGEFTPVTRFNGDCEFPRTIIDSKGIIHICYQRRSQKQYELVYQQKVADKNMWTGEMVIHSSAYSFTDCSILYVNDILTVYWIREDTIYYSSSSDVGTTWSKPQKYNFPGGRQLMCMSYKSSIPYESEKTAISDIPGNFINGFKLAFFQDAVSSQTGISSDELKNVVADNLHLLKGGLEELKESYSDLRDSITSINLLQKNMERELTKCFLKLNLLENEIRQIKASNVSPDNRIDSDIKFLKKELLNLKSELGINQTDEGSV